jgi:hypothetical protein
VRVGAHPPDAAPGGAVMHRHHDVGVAGVDDEKHGAYPNSAAAAESAAATKGPGNRKKNSV